MIGSETDMPQQFVMEIKDTFGNDFPLAELYIDGDTTGGTLDVVTEIDSGISLFDLQGGVNVIQYRVRRTAGSVDTGLSWTIDRFGWLGI